MTKHKKIAVAIVHGVGNHNPNDPNAEKNPEKIARAIKAAFKAVVGTDEPLVTEIVYWDWESGLQPRENVMLEKMAGLHFTGLRRLFFDVLGDAVAYQPSENNHDVYDAIQTVMADTLHRLAQQTARDAPLCVIAHSLGTIIASNYFYDLQQKPSAHLSRKVRNAVGENVPLVRGDTLALLYTMGSPIAIWGLRFDNFGTPVTVPAPKLPIFHRHMTGEWLNFYDKDDLIAYPLQNLNDDYANAVEDVDVNVGNILTSWNPASHLGYWTNEAIINRITDGLVRTYETLNKE